MPGADSPASSCDGWAPYRQFDQAAHLLFDLTLDATNWRGAETQQILSSVIQTARLRDLNPRDVIADRLRAPQPTVSPALALLQQADQPR